MAEFVFDEYNMRALPHRKRFQKIVQTFDKAVDESVRWDCVWLAGEMSEQVPSEFKDDIADFLALVLQNDDNSIVRHEAAFQLGLYNMRQKIPLLLTAIVNDKSILVKHEAIEAIGLLRERSEFCMAVLQDATTSEDEAVSSTAKFVLKRLERLKGRGEYRGEAIV